MKRIYGKRTRTNTDGYKQDSVNRYNTINIIPSSNITMEGVKEPVVATPVYGDLEGEPVIMKPNKRYLFKGADKVIERHFQKGGEVEYEKFLESLPPNLQDTSEYDMRYLWENQGRPSSFREAIERDEPLFSLVQEEDGTENYHGYSIEPNTMRFLKRKGHPTLQKEIDWFNSNDPEAEKLRKEYELDTSGDYYQYKKRVMKKYFKKGGVVKFQNGALYSPTPNPNWKGIPYTLEDEEEVVDPNQSLLNGVPAIQEAQRAQEQSIMGNPAGIMDNPNIRGVGTNIDPISVSDKAYDINNSNLNAGVPTTTQDTYQAPEWQSMDAQLPNPYGGVDIETGANVLGQGIANGNPLSIVSGAGKVGLSLYRNISSGYAHGKSRNRQIKDYWSKQRKDSAVNQGNSSMI